MTTSTNRIQPPNKPLLIGRWAPHEEFGVHPIGSKPKQTLICPADANEPFLIPRHPYLFKRAEGWRQHQLWSEVIAFRLSLLCRVDVPPAFVALNERTGELGVLIEFFYHYPDEVPPSRLVHGTDVLRRLRLGDETGRPHGARTNVTVSRRFKAGCEANWWGRVLTFDALIGNTDRHTENWGFLVRQVAGEEPTYSFAPAFDNGTSLAYEMSEGRLAACSDGGWIDSYIDRGKHHCGWDATDDGPTAHVPLVAKFATHFPEAVEAMRQVLTFDPSAPEKVLAECATFDVSLQLSPVRVQFLASLIEARRKRLQAALGG